MFIRELSLSSFLLVFVVMLNEPSIFAKASIERMVVRGGGLARSVEITDRAMLKGFDPWSGQFIDWAKQRLGNPTSRDPHYKALDPQTGKEALWKFIEPPDQQQSYQVFFYMKWNGRRSVYDLHRLKMIYALRYRPGGNGEAGYVYLPGRNEQWSVVNLGTIFRAEHDGKWHYASAAWDALMNHALHPS
jgi:hypothetical protein